MIIGIANNLFPPFSRGSGAEVMAAKKAAELQAAGHEVFIISTKPLGDLTPDTENHYYLSSNYSQLGKFSAPKKLFWHLQQILFPPHRTKLDHILTVRHPNLFITNNLMGIGFALPQLLHQHRIRHEHVLHDIQLLHPSGLMYCGKEDIIISLFARLYQFFTRKAMAKADRIISPSHWLLSVHENRGFFRKQEKAVEPNFKLVKRNPKPMSRPLHFVFTGQLEKHKGLALLLSAWQEASLSAADARLTIAGGGTLQEEIREAAVALGNLEFVGLLDRRGIESLLDTADVVVVPSLVYENSPTSLWEAAIHGCRAIASDLGGIPELAPYLDLTLFKPGDKLALTEALKKMVNQY